MNCESAIVELANVSFNYGDLEVIADLSLSIHAGEFVSIVGPSGCGKTTLLKLLAQLEQPASGTVQRATGTGCVQAGLMLQDPVLLPWRTAIQNVCLPFEIGSQRKKDASEIRASALQALASVGLSDFVDTYPTQLSGGMRARASLARSLVVEHELQLFDEPFSSVDELTREILAELVSKLLNERGTASVLVTHSVEEAVFLSDRVVVLTDRPASVAETVPVDLSHPRTAGMRSFGVFREAVAAVRRHLRIESG